MSPALLAMALLSTPHVDRDAYGVPRIQATSYGAAFRAFGETVANDRLWQMEMSRRVALGRSAEVLGKAAISADTDTLKQGYSDEEYSKMFESLPAKAKTAFTEYAAGVNDAIQARKAAGTLPQEYQTAGLEPEPWTVKDSMAIEVLLARRFGTGGAGELRNLALYLYLQTQPCKAKVLDVVDDFAWQNDSRSIPTVQPSDDPLAKSHYVFPSVTREHTEAQLKAMPKVSLLELVPAIRAVTGDDSKLIAEQVAAPFETGSYCMVVSPKRSTTGKALLLSGPQMGFTTPSIIHEIALDAPGVQVAGIDVPGIPAVVIGNTPNLAWGLTTGVADMADIVVAGKSGDEAYAYGPESRPLVRTKLVVKVKDSSDVTVERVRAEDGPVIFESRGTKSVFIQKSAFWKKEVASWSALYDIYAATSPVDIDRSVDAIDMNLNFFFATVNGDIGWRYLGHMPKRAPGFDPRFPLPAGPESAWRGSMSRAEMPHVDNPAGGLIANWNNKPAAWWPNMDTPAWGRIFRNEVLLKSLTKPKLAPWDLERAAWEIAREDTDTNGHFEDLFRTGFQKSPSPAGELVSQFDGWTFQGAASNLLYRESVRALRRSLFLKHVGNFTNEGFFEQVVQPSAMANALDGKTKYDYLAGRDKVELAREAVESAMSSLTGKYGDDTNNWPLDPGGIRFLTEPPVAYSNRGTYIQINQLTSPPMARSVAPPGVTESGEHSMDQVPLARQWTFKPMWRFMILGK